MESERDSSRSVSASPLACEKGDESQREGAKAVGAKGDEVESRSIVEYEQLLERLATLAQAFGVAHDLKSVFRALCHFALASTPCNGIFISLYDEDRDERHAVYAWSEGQEIDLSTLPPMPMTESPHSRAVSTNQLIITDDLQAAIVNLPRVYVADEVDPQLPLSSLVAPMSFMGRSLGAVEVQSPRRAAFGASDATAMRMAANLAAVAIENVRLLKRELERAEREAESEKMRSLGQLAAGVAHDFNNALAAILGRTQLLLRTATEEKQRRNLEVIETAALDAAETVRRIQTFARRSPGEPLGMVSVSRLIADAVQLTRTRWEDDARAHGLHYDLDFRRDFEGEDLIAANPSEMREVLVNMIFNALDAMPGGGRISLREMKRERWIIVEIEDTGHGVPAALRERIFEPFFTTKGPKGSGLGLAVSYGIIHRHGGSVEVESREGEGTTFRLSFPQTRAGASAPVAPLRRSALPSRRVLVVDDEEVVREVLVEMLTALDQKVVAVRSAAAALDALAADRFDLMLTDLSMPAMDGLTLAAEARRRAPEMLIALATGYGQTIPGGAPDSVLFDFIVNKPFKISDLEASLLTLYAGAENQQ
ncbi:MAG TPA: ATP-binding protein [Pyrinomonadaceae bacterium]|jgi:signal transduction histidine kinase